MKKGIVILAVNTQTLEEFPVYVFENFPENNLEITGPIVEEDWTKKLEKIHKEWKAKVVKLSTFRKNIGKAVVVDVDNELKKRGGK